MKASLTTPKPTLDAGAFRSIPLDWGVFWNQLGSGRSMEIRAIWYSPMRAEGQSTGAICCGGNSSQR
jgi:hypothetical protein